MSSSSSMVVQINVNRLIELERQQATVSQSVTINNINILQIIPFNIQFQTTTKDSVLCVIVI